MSVQALLQELLDDRAVIAERVVTRVRSEIPAFAGVPLDEQKAGIEASIEMIVRSRMEDPGGSFGEGAQLLRDIGERRARQGVPVDDLLRAWRMGIEETTAHARDLAARSETRPAELFDLFQEAFGLADEAMLSVAGGHRREPDAADAEVERHAALVRGALLGRFSANEIHSGFAAHALDPLATYRAFRARALDGDTATRINRALDCGPGETQRSGIAAVVDEELVGFCCTPIPRGELPLVAVGSPGIAAELPASYRTAGRVLAAAEIFGLAGVHDLSSAGLLAAVIEDPELGAALAEGLIAPVLERSNGAEILAAVREWLGAGMRVDPAAERLYVHPNTVRYRLRRYEELTGADLSETEDAFRVWWALQREQAIGTPAPG